VLRGKYKLVVKPHKIGFFMYLKVGKKTGNFISATLFYAANVTKKKKPNEGISF
jgi:hypothetical protein